LNSCEFTRGYMFKARVSILASLQRRSKARSGGVNKWFAVS
jgi:hypothetical protein